MSASMECLGYCGRALQGDSECSMCPWGYRPSDSVCEKCEGSLPLYDWLYLGFMAALPLILHTLSIAYLNSKRSFRQNPEVSSSCSWCGHFLVWHYLLVLPILEAVLASVLTLLVYEPAGSLTIHSCEVLHLADWYPLFYNPTVDYSESFHCTQEIVYPRYTMVMTYYAFNLLSVLILRPILTRFSSTLSPPPAQGPQPTAAIYPALYLLPSLVALQAICGGLIYFSFPYLILCVVMITQAVDLSLYPDQSSYGLIHTTFTTGPGLLSFAFHCSMYAYAIAAVPGSTSSALVYVLLLLLTPVPFLYYVLTQSVTDPNRIAGRMEVAISHPNNPRRTAGRVRFYPPRGEGSVSGRGGRSRDSMRSRDSLREAHVRRRNELERNELDFEDRPEISEQELAERADRVLEEMRLSREALWASMGESSSPQRQ